MSAQETGREPFLAGPHAIAIHDATPPARSSSELEIRCKKVVVATAVLFFILGATEVLPRNETVGGTGISLMGLWSLSSLREAYHSDSTDRSLAFVKAFFQAAAIAPFAYFGFIR